MPFHLFLLRVRIILCIQQYIDKRHIETTIPEHERRIISNVLSVRQGYVLVILDVENVFCINIDDKLML